MVVLVTGGSEGIGYELAKCFAGDGHELVLVARDRARLQAAAGEIARAHGVPVSQLSYDLSVPGGVERLYAELERRGIVVDVLVNNAGVGVYGPFAATALERELAMMRLNMEAVVVLTKLVLPQMLARASGAVLNVASTAAFQPGPLMAVYYASKSFVLSFSEALANELEGTGVRVSALCPGPTITGFQRRAGLGNALLFRRGAMSAAEVARRGYRSFTSGRTTIVPGRANRLLAFLVRLGGRRLSARVVRRLQEARAAPRR